MCWLRVADAFLLLRWCCWCVGGGVGVVDVDCVLARLFFFAHTQAHTPTMNRTSITKHTPTRTTTTATPPPPTTSTTPTRNVGHSTCMHTRPDHNTASQILTNVAAVAVEGVAVAVVFWC